MKKSYAILFLILLLGFQKISAQNNNLKPQEVFNLYFNALVKYDDQALTSLNGYLEPFLGKDNVYQISARDSYSKEVDNLTQNFLSGFSEETANQSKAESQIFFNVMLDNFKNANYVVKNIESLPHETDQNQVVSGVNFEVTFKVPAKISDPEFKDEKKVTGEELKNYLNIVTNEVKKADKIISVTQRFKLYQIKKNENTYYWNGGAEELAGKLYEFYFKKFNPKNK
ncbi:hypothetical protein [Chryseobacterium populi]|uniref:Uncharacterized protein n=1 Tax=Chryseobacterium populi TaxID=1144316 RepID=J2KKR4_9FLAO|nr:hypothetical protein [Chryseobacterium populi]EJL73663.1 hypothetical protein PMI13_01425 [Chryseobacterium populi]